MRSHAPVGQGLEPADGGLRAEIPRLRHALERHLEHRVGAQRVGVDPVLVAGRDHHHPEPEDVGDAVQGAARIARIVDAGRQPARHIEPPLHLTQGQQPRIRGQRAAVETGGHRLAVHR